MDSKTSSRKSKTRWIVLVAVLVIVGAAAVAISIPSLETSSSKNELAASVWTTDKPANYSSLVTLFFLNTDKGVMYELVGNSYMAEAFNYTVTNGILQITKSGSPLQQVPFSLAGGTLILHYDGSKITLVRDMEPLPPLNNKY